MHVGQQVRVIRKDCLYYNLHGCITQIGTYIRVKFDHDPVPFGRDPLFKSDELCLYMAPTNINQFLLETLLPRINNG